MSIRKQLLGPVQFISVLTDDSIDFENWPKEDQESYFVDSYKLPPILEGKTPVIYTLRQLTGREMYGLRMLQQQYANEPEGTIHPEISKYIIRSGLVKISGVETQDQNNNINVFEIKTIKTPYGPIMSEDNYYDLIALFTAGSEVHLLGVIYQISF